MKGRVAILGLGSRGTGWAETCLAAGWDVHGFDPDDRAGRVISGGASWPTSTNSASTASASAETLPGSLSSDPAIDHPSWRLSR